MHIYMQDGFLRLKQVDAVPGAPIYGPPLDVRAHICQYVILRKTLFENIIENFIKPLMNV